MATSKKPHHRTITQYKSYSFKDKDPIIDQVRTIVADEGESYQKIHDMSGVSTSTLWNWFRGETRRPQFAAVMAVVRSLGYDMTITRGASANDRPSKIRLRRNIRSKSEGASPHH